MIGFNVHSFGAAPPGLAYLDDALFTDYENKSVLLTIE
jgi:hypothetical protein